MRSAESLHTHSPNGTSSPPVLRTKQFLSPLQNPMAFDAAKASAPDSTLVNLKNFIGNLSVHVKTIQKSYFHTWHHSVLSHSRLHWRILPSCGLSDRMRPPTYNGHIGRSTSLSNWSGNRLHYVGQFVRCNFILKRDVAFKHVIHPCPNPRQMNRSHRWIEAARHSSFRTTP